MHDPMVVAFEIRRPWPKRGRTGSGRRYWPALITVWHVEPGGADSGEVCKHYDRWQDDDGWHTKFRRGWKFHVHHWRVQVHAWQRFRRWAFQRCAWCGELHRKGDPVNVGMAWESERAKHWWSSDPGVYHARCTEPQREANLRQQGIERAKHELRMLAERTKDEVLVEGSYFNREDLPAVLGNYMRSLARSIASEKELTLQMHAAAQPSVIEAVRVLQQAGAEPELLTWLAKVAATARLTTEDVNVLAFRYGIRIIPSALQTTARTIATERAAALGDAADALLELGLDTRRAKAIDIVRRLQSAERRKADAL